MQELEELGVPLDSVQIRYSPFSRTMETAREVARMLGVPFDSPSCIVSGLVLHIKSISVYFAVICVHRYSNVYGTSNFACNLFEL